MQTGIFGKLPAKRDFIALHLPHEFRNPWEEWLQASIAACRDSLGAAFQDRFLTAPLWRFWLGRAVCGIPVSGAIMPSVDGVGRYFPLSICACGTPQETIAPPVVDAFASWHAAVEDRLLATLDPAYQFDAGQLLAGLDLPAAARATGAAAAESVLSALFAKDMQDVAADQSWWWTVGGGAFGPRVLRFPGLPGPYEFATFLAPANELQHGRGR